MKKIRTAVVGTGYLGKFHAQKYALLPQAELVAVCDTDPLIAHQQAEIHQLKTFTNYRELIGQVDAVSIVVPTKLHYEVALFFLQHGVHVLVEKPISTTLQEADELIRVAKEQDLILQVGHIERFNPGFKSLEARVKTPQFIESTRLAPFKTRGADANVILDLMIHDLDLIQALMRQPIQSIKASGVSLITRDVDVAKVKVEFSDGRLAFLKAGRTNPNTQRELSVYQEDEHLHLDMQAKTLTRYQRNSANSSTEALIEEILIPNEDALYNELNAFLNAILGLEAVTVSGEDGFIALESALKITSLILASKIRS